MESKVFLKVKVPKRVSIMWNSIAIEKWSKRRKKVQITIILLFRVSFDIFMIFYVNARKNFRLGRIFLLNIYIKHALAFTIRKKDISKKKYRTNISKRNQQTNSFFMKLFSSFGRSSNIKTLCVCFFSDSFWRSKILIIYLQCGRIHWPLPLSIENIWIHRNLSGKFGKSISDFSSNKNGTKNM